MDAGDWERAARLLQGVSRRSPFAPWRLFCKAMVCFGAGDDEGLRRIIGLLPGDFILSHTVAEWRRLCTGEGGGGPVEIRRALGLEGGEVAALAGELRQALHRRQTARPDDRSTASPPRSTPTILFTPGSTSSASPACPCCGRSCP